jgi:hypothetical protein
MNSEHIPGQFTDGQWADNDEQQTSRNEEMEMVENVLGERLPQAKYTNYGSFRDLLGSQLPASQVDGFNALWVGKITLDKRTDVDAEALAEVLSPDNIARYFVQTSPSACPRCIDGRCIEHYGDRPDESLDSLRGPQAPGGSVTVALCDRIASWDQVYTDQFSLTRDIDRIEAIYEKNGLMLGGHIDDHAPEGMTGCGAIDKVPEILQTITSPAAQQQVRKLARMMLGDTYETNRVDAILGRFLALQGVADEYFMKHEEEDTYEYRQKAVDTVLENNPNGIETLRGPHKEVALVVNLVEDTTFHRDKFAVDNGEEIQLFNYDLWWSYQLADRLHPTDESVDAETREINAELRARFITARILFSIGTCMALTDGTLQLIVREQEQAAA